MVSHHDGSVVARSLIGLQLSDAQLRELSQAGLAEARRGAVLRLMRDALVEPKGQPFVALFEGLPGDALRFEVRAASREALEAAGIATPEPASGLAMGMPEDSPTAAPLAEGGAAAGLLDAGSARPLEGEAVEGVEGVEGMGEEAEVVPGGITPLAGLVQPVAEAAPTAPAATNSEATAALADSEPEAAPVAPPAPEAPAPAPAPAAPAPADAAAAQPQL